VDPSTLLEPEIRAPLAEGQLQNAAPGAAMLRAEVVLSLMLGRNAKWLTLNEMRARIARYRKG